LYQQSILASQVIKLKLPTEDDGLASSASINSALIPSGSPLPLYDRTVKMSKHQTSDTDDSDSSPEDAAIAKTKKMLTNNRDAARRRQQSNGDIQIPVNNEGTIFLEHKLEETEKVRKLLSILLCNFLMMASVRHSSRTRSIPMS
jgi:hypothetical protein